MLRDENGGGGRLVDLREQVTVFVTTVGAPTYAACLAHLAAQDCRFTLRAIERVAPMHVAFQRMLDECRTPFYVQVDEDMLLHPHAVRSLHERLAAAGPATALVAGRLYDAHLERRILGVKIFRHAIVRHYPLGAVSTFEVDQVARLEADGYAVLLDDTEAGEVLGLHGTVWTPPSIYERYATLERRRITRGRRPDWFEVYGPVFLERFRQEPSDENFFALMGVVAGVLSSRHGVAGSKDWRTYDALPGFAALRAFLDAFAAQHAPRAGEAAELGSAAPPR